MQGPDTGRIVRNAELSLPRLPARDAELANSMAEQAIYLQKALDDIKTASKCSDKKGDFWYNQAMP